ncbi:MAG TPA: hypothetical protein VFH77_15610 [Streptomyces sp.]|nr:hypothetical protein [Streptomyces sp.]
MPTTRPTRTAVAKGLRVDRIPGLPPYRTDDGHIALPLWALRNGRHIGDTDLTMSPAEAELLRDQLAALLAEQGTE